MAKSTKNSKKMKDLVKNNKKTEEKSEIQEDEIKTSNEEEFKPREPEMKSMEDPFPNKNTLRFNEVAAFFDVNERTVRLWVDHGHLEEFKTPGGQRRITKSSVEKCIFRKFE